VYELNRKCKTIWLYMPDYLALKAIYH